MRSTAAALTARELAPRQAGAPALDDHVLDILAAALADEGEGDQP